MQKHHFDPTCNFKLYHQSGVQVDLWKDEFADDIVKCARPVELAGRTIQIADPHDLIAMKLRARRLKDDYAIPEILASNEIDEAKLQGFVTQEQFARLEAIRNRPN